MTKADFMKALEQEIAKLPKEEQEEILHDYEEYFQLGMLDGKSAEEIATSLGNPRAISKEILATHQLEKVEEKTSVTNFVKAIWMVIGLGFFNLIVVLGPFLLIAGLVLGVWITGASLTLSPLLVVINVIIYPEVFLLFDVFNAMTLSGLGIFILVLAYVITQKFMKVFIRYLKYNVRIVKGGEKNVE